MYIMDVSHGCVSWLCVMDVFMDVSHGCIGWMDLIDIIRGCTIEMYLMYEKCGCIPWLFAAHECVECMSWVCLVKVPHGC